MTARPTRFTVHGPITIPCKGKGPRRHIAEGCVAFWKDPRASSLRDRRGCYAFGIRHGASTKLFYVGLAAKQALGKECFTSHKVAEHYNVALRKRPRGKPVLFLVVAARTKPPVIRIADLESFLIQTAIGNHQPLSNVRKRGKRAWTISGVAYSRGRPSADARQLKLVLGLDA